MKRLRSKSSLIVDLTRWDIFLTSLKIYFASQCYTLNFLKDSVKENEDKLISDTSLPLLVSTIAEIFFQGQNLKPGLKKKIVGIILKTSNRLSIYLKNSGFIKKNEISTNINQGILILVFILLSILIYNTYIHNN